MITPSIVGVPARTSSITSLRRSPAAAWKLTGAVVNSVGVTPAVPPPCTGVLSWIVSEPLYMVMRLERPVLLTKRRICAGHGRYSYCHPDSGLKPNWLAVIACENGNCGIGYCLPLHGSLPFTWIGGPPSSGRSTSRAIYYGLLDAHREPSEGEVCVWTGS